jgi:solute carrier family 45 protein 1/2/4
LILVPNGKLLGKQFGDKYPYEEALAKAKLEKLAHGEMENTQEHDGPGGRLYGSDYEYDKTMATLSANTTYTDTEDEEKEVQFKHEEHPWGIFFTVLGTVLLDFDADACQSPSRAYLLDVTVSGN